MTMIEQVLDRSVAPAAQADAYLIFRVGDESHGTAILDIRKIVHFRNSTPLRHMP